ncbi:MAG TPA: ABC transporter permease subunit, partial [Chloroflexota bacterium]|nr:ABC transporter permease subunit [Chloroflexota bacterium]
DAAFEEASTISGASLATTLLRVVIPGLAPAVIVVFLLSLIRSFEAFEIELVLGTPIRFQVYSTKIYALINQSPVNYGAATALSMFILLATLPLIFLQLWISRRRSYTTITGKARTTRTRLRSWRWPAAALVLALAVLGTLLPVAFMLLGSFMGVFGYFDAREVWTLRHWADVLGDPTFVGSVANTIVLGVGTAVAAVSLYSLMAYVTVRTRFGGRWAFDVLSWVPFTIPGIILGVAYLLFVLRTPVLTPLYGSMVVLIVVSTLAVMTTATQLLKGTMLQLGAELEEAAKTLGSSWWQTFRRIVVPLMAPSLVVAAVMTFASAAREVSVIIPVTSSATQPLAVLQLGYLLAGNQSSAAVIGSVTVVITVAAAICVRTLATRAGVRA